MANLNKQQQTAVQKEVKKQLKHDEKVLEKKIEKKLHKQLFNKATKTTVFLGSKFRDHATTAIIAAFSFIIALAWKDLIVKLVKENTKLAALEAYPYLAELYAAVIITIIAIIGIALVSQWAKKDEKK